MYVIVIDSAAEVKKKSISMMTAAANPSVNSTSERLKRF